MHPSILQDVSSKSEHEVASPFCMPHSPTAKWKSPSQFKDMMAGLRPFFGGGTSVKLCQTIRYGALQENFPIRNSMGFSRVGFLPSGFSSRQEEALQKAASWSLSPGSASDLPNLMMILHMILSCWGMASFQVRTVVLGGFNPLKRYMFVNSESGVL